MAGGRRGRNPLRIHHGDQAVNRSNREYDEKLRELDRQSRKNVWLLDVELADGVDTEIAHNLRRRVSVTVTPPRDGVTNGSISEVRAAGRDPKRFVVLRADGWGATVTVDVKCEANDG